MNSEQTTFNPEENIKLVKLFYATLGKGDIASVLNLLADDVEWEMPHPREVVPFGGIWSGRDQVGQFFKVTHDCSEFKKVELKEFIAQNDKVVVIGYTEVLVKSNNRLYGNDLVAIWTIDNQKIKKMKDYMDTAPAVLAFSNS